MSVLKRSSKTERSFGGETSLSQESGRITFHDLCVGICDALAGVITFIFFCNSIIHLAIHCIIGCRIVVSHLICAFACSFLCVTTGTNPYWIWSCFRVIFSNLSRLFQFPIPYFRTVVVNLFGKHAAGYVQSMRECHCNNQPDMATVNVWPLPPQLLWGQTFEPVLIPALFDCLRRLPDLPLARQAAHTSSGTHAVHLTTTDLNCLPKEGIICRLSTFTFSAIF